MYLKSYLSLLCQCFETCLLENLEATIMMSVIFATRINMLILSFCVHIILFSKIGLMFCLLITEETVTLWSLYLLRKFQLF